MVPSAHSYRRGQGAGPEAILADLDAPRHQLAAEVTALTDEDLPSLTPLPYGDVPIAMFSQILVMEAGIHADDLAAARGQERSLPAAVIVATEADLRVFLPGITSPAREVPEPGVAVALRGTGVALAYRYGEGGWQALPPDDPLTPAISVEADDSSVLLFTVGRIPATDPRLSFFGDAALAGRVEARLPGP